MRLYRHWVTETTTIAVDGDPLLTIGFLIIGIPRNKRAFSFHASGAENWRFW